MNRLDFKCAMPVLKQLPGFFAIGYCRRVIVHFQFFGAN